MNDSDSQELSQYLVHVLGVQDPYAARLVNTTGGIPAARVASFHKAKDRGWTVPAIEDAMRLLHATEAAYHVRDGILYSPDIFMFHATQRQKEQQWLERQAARTNAALGGRPRAPRPKPIHTLVHRHDFPQVQHALDERRIPYKVVDKFPQSSRHALLIFVPDLHALPAPVRALVNTEGPPAVPAVPAVPARGALPDSHGVDFTDAVQVLAYREQQKAARAQRR